MRLRRAPCAEADLRLVLMSLARGGEFPFAAPPFIVTAAFTNLSGKLDRLRVSITLVDEKNQALTPPITGEFGSDREVTPDDVFDHRSLSLHAHSKKKACIKCSSGLAMIFWASALCLLDWFHHPTQRPASRRRKEAARLPSHPGKRPKK